MPKSLYGRAALILILPVLVLQIIVSVVFVQKHFEDVTGTMAQNMNRQLNMVFQTIQDTPSLSAAQQRARAMGLSLDIDIEVMGAFGAKLRVAPKVSAFDLTRATVEAALYASELRPANIHFIGRSYVVVFYETRHGLMTVRFERDRVSAQNPHQFLVLTAVFGTLMTIISYLFLRNQLRPIKRMASAAQAYGKGRIVPYRPSGSIEVRSAGVAFLAMRKKIERQTQTRTMMLSAVSHDLRTPLTRLRLGLSLLDEDVQPLLEDVRDMQRLLDGFLEFAQGNAEDVIEDISPEHLLRLTVQTAQRAQLNVICGAIEGGADVLALPSQAITRALENLISNALRHGTLARMSLFVDGQTLKFVVEDDGPGIPEDRRERAIMPFVRLDTARNQNHGAGVGLGLSIVNDIARSYGGRLLLETSEELGGLKVTLTLGY